MKKRVKRTTSKNKVFKTLVDGFNGILALMIYNFLLYLSSIANIGGFIEKMNDATGYFYLNTFIDLGFTKTGLAIALILTFVIAFIFGVLMAKLIRKIRY